MDIDKKIKDKLSEKESIPEGILEKVNDAFNEIRNGEEIKRNKKIKSKINKKIVASFIGACLILSFSIGPKVLASIEEFLKDRGIQKAKSNSYVQEMLDNEVKDNGILIKVNEIIPDKNKIGISFTLNFDDVDKLNDVSGLRFGFNIKDNNDRVILGKDEEGMYSPYFTGVEWNIDLVNSESGEIKCDLIITDTKSIIEDIKSISLEIVDIALYKNNADSIEKINGNWNYELDLYDGVTNVESIGYVLEDENESIKFDSMVASATNTMVKMYINTDVLKVDENIVNKMIITDENENNIYKFTNGNMENIDGGVRIAFMYDLTTFDNLDKVKIIIKDINGKDIKINLRREI